MRASVPFITGEFLENGKGFRPYFCAYRWSQGGAKVSHDARTMELRTRLESKIYHYVTV